MPNLLWMERILLLLLLLAAGPGLVHPPAAAARTGGGDPWQLTLLLNGAPDGLVLPVSLYVDEARERYYVVDSGSGRLLSYDRQGEFLRAFSADGALDRPHALVRLDDQTLLVLERGRNSLTRIDLRHRTTEPVVLHHQGREVFVDRLVVDRGNLYVLDRLGGRVLQLDDRLQVTAVHNPPEDTGNLVDLLVREGHLWLLDQQRRQIITLTPEGQAGPSIALSEVTFPTALARDRGGFFYVLDRHRGRITVYDQDGRQRYHFLSKGHGRRHLYYPAELRFDPWGRLCVVDQGNNRVLVFERRGLSRPPGGGTAPGSEREELP
ncbi:NHL repeat containing protein [Desulfurivibrio alkaliphilus]|uniref:NHL repeat containing protein n=1 Tax=Desulfurivibrio alkaliphilus (strain DSM 19089 / UNIQEM U267 / AHT2) TaxID=589865 RepID=D6Z1N2_DESAT|nr:NHL repeat containing protein [Desulfurivibrio alkaliphilus]ADH85457.1 NHL repeat containing protein [Desulfurivibrio alkaliphilus AHT 2]